MATCIAGDDEGRALPTTLAEVNAPPLVTMRWLMSAPGAVVSNAAVCRTVEDPGRCSAGDPGVVTVRGPPPMAALIRNKGGADGSVPAHAPARLAGIRKDDSGRLGQVLLTARMRERRVELGRTHLTQTKSLGHQSRVCLTRSSTRQSSR